MEKELLKQKFPVGIIIILIIIGYGGFSLLVSSFNNPVYQLGPKLLTGIEAAIVHIILAFIYGVIFYGIFRRFYWARNATVGFYIFSTTLIILNAVFFLKNKSMYNSYYQNISPETLNYPAMLTASFIFGMVMGGCVSLIIIIYLLKNKSFFVN